MRVLVTGCAGFIGSNLCRFLLDDGHEVRGIDDLSAGDRDRVPEGVEFAELDIRDPEIRPLFQGVQAVFHLAARNCLTDCLAHPVETASINVEGTVRVLEASRVAAVERFFYADTSAVYEGVEALPSVEDRVCPVGPYAVAKHAGALFVRSYGRLHGLPYTIFRFFNVYGPAQDHRRSVPPVMSAFILSLLRGETPVIYGTGQKRRDFIYIDDLCRFVLRCLRDSRSEGRVVNVGFGENYSVQEIFEAVARELHMDVAPQMRADLPGEAQVTLADISAARALGFEPEIDLIEGIKRSIEYVRNVVMTEEPQA